MSKKCVLILVKFTLFLHVYLHIFGVYRGSWRWMIARTRWMRRNDVIDRFRFFVGHFVKWSLKFMLISLDIAKNEGIKELILMKDDVAGIDNSLMYWIL